jgi:hypothetical protein
MAYFSQTKGNKITIEWRKSGRVPTRFFVTKSLQVINEKKRFIIPIYLQVTCKEQKQIQIQCLRTICGCEVRSYPDPDNSVADPGCLSRIPDPDFYPSRIPDPKTASKERIKQICCHTFFCRHKFHKIKIFFIFQMPKKKIWANFQRIIEIFTQKFDTKLSKIWVWIQESKRHRIPDSGSGSATLPDNSIVKKPRPGDETRFSISRKIELLKMARLTLRMCIILGPNRSYITVTNSVLYS